MGKSNNFKNLMDEEERNTGELPKKIGENIDYNVGFAGFSGNVVQTFFSTIFGVLINMSGGDSDSSCFRKNDGGNRAKSSTPDQNNDKPAGKP